MRATGSAFLAGAGFMALEFLAARWLAPAFGLTIVVWSILISVALLAGSAGAWLGGRLSRAGRVPPGSMFLVASAGTAAATVLVAGARDALLGVPVLVGAAALGLLVLLVPLVALGAVLPLLAARTGGDRGVVVGRLVAASTLGSLAGTLATAILLLPSCGARATGFGLAAALVAGGFLAGLRRPGAGLGLLLLALGGFALPPPAPTGDVHESPYGVVTVARTDGGTAILVNGVNQGAAPPGPLGRGALLPRRQYFELLPYLRPAARSALVIGLGGALVPRMLDARGVTTTTVEIDPVLVDVVRTELGFTGAVIVGDGRAVLRRRAERYDFVVLDAFRGEAPPSHLLTREAFAEIADRLAPGGLVCVHLVGRPGHPATAAVARTMAAVFPHRLAAAGGVGEELMDLFLFASERPLVVPPHPELAALGWIGNETFEPDVSGAELLTDDRSRFEILNEPLARELRIRSR